MSYIREIRALVGHRPLLSAGATIIVRDNSGRILLNKRSDTGTWGIPGGAMELGERLEETAARELYEETGLRAASFRFLHVFSGPDFHFIYPNQDELYSVVALYLAEHVTGELAILDDESTELAYYALDELPKLESRAAKILEWLADSPLINA